MGATSSLVDGGDLVDAREMSANPPTVTITAPEVTIVSPQDGATFWQSQLVTLRADVYDPEEGALGGSNAVWTSSIDGELGTGTKLITVKLSTGSHTITVEATDGSARTHPNTLTRRDASARWRHPRRHRPLRRRRWRPTVSAISRHHPAGFVVHQDRRFLQPAATLIANLRDVPLVL